MDEQLPEHLRPILEIAKAQFSLGKDSYHGPAHWLRVLRNVTYIADNLPEADRTVCELFALLHDCQRMNESTDPQHGQRAAEFVKTLYSKDQIDISDSQLRLLVAAIFGHAKGQISTEPTIGACWDADRLELPRVGIVVDDRLLSTEIARKMLHCKTK